MIEETYTSGFYRIQADINLDAICHNIIEIKKTLKQDTKLMAVIKADGYGHGAVPIAEALDAYCGMYGVAVMEEAADLRNAGIKKDIMLLGAVFKEQISEASAYDVIVSVFSYDTAEMPSRESAKRNKTGRLHIKIDTGMGRLGFLPVKESIDEIKKIAGLPYIKAEGIFTHFACADHADKSSALKQYHTFTEFIRQLELEGISFPIKHASNSAAIIDMQDTELNLVRSGITTYGMYPSDEVIKSNIKLMPAMEIKTHVSHVKTVSKGFKVGYGSTFEAKRNSVIATIPVGYADGYPRRLSGKGCVLINGRRAPIAGRVCMDQFMIDVTDAGDVRTGDIVTLIGNDGSERITVEEQAELAGIFNYEYVCNVSKRVPRIYYKDNVPFLIRKDREIFS